MEGWKQDRLGKISDISIGGTPSREVMSNWSSADEGFLWVSIADMNKNRIDKTNEYISADGIKRSNAKLVVAGTLIMSFKLSIGKVAFAQHNLYTNEAICAFNNPQINNKYLYYGLQFWNLLKDVDVAIKGATLNKKKINNIDVFFPESIDEQIKIANILSTVDSVIEQTEELIAKYRNIKQGLMHDLLAYGIDTNGNIRNPKTHKFETKNGLLVPSEWAITCVNDILTLLTDYDANGSFEDMKNYVSTYDTENYAWFVRATDLESKTPLDRVKYVDEDSYRFLRKSYLNGGEVLIAKRGEIGKVYKMPNVPIKATLAPNMYLLRLNNKVVSDFVYYYFLSSRGRKSLVDNNASTTLGALYKDTVKAIPFPLPTKDEQNKITAALLNQDNLIEKEEENLLKYKKIKQGLMHDLLTPIKRVKL